MEIGSHVVDTSTIVPARRHCVTASSKPLGVPDASNATSAFRGTSSPRPSVSAACRCTSWRAEMPTSAPRSRATAPQSNPIDPAPMTATFMPAAIAARLPACNATAIGSTSDAFSIAIPTGSGARHDASTRISSAMPPSTKMPSIADVTMRHSCGRPASQHSHAPHATYGRTATAVSSSNTPAISCPMVVADKPVRTISRSEPQIPALRTRTRTPGPSGAGMSTTRTPSSVLRTARTARFFHSPVVSAASPRRRNAMATSGSILGNPVLRKEDRGILTGETEYYDDLKVDGLLHVAFVRSTVAHANIASIDAGDARSVPGVVAVYTASDFELPDVHGFVMLPPTMNRPPLAKGKVRFVGDIVAMVVAESKAEAMDGAEAVIVDYDELLPLPTVQAAIADGAPLLHDAQGSNVANAMGTGP